MENDPTSDVPKHAILGPSAAERWTTCPASIRVIASLPSVPSSAYADEGTAAHALAEIILNCEVLDTYPPARCAQNVEEWRERYHIDDEQHKEMLGYVRIYVDFVKERLALHPYSILLVEQRVETGVPSCWGTADVIIASPTHIEIIDLKYGMGVRVDAENNPQLRLYGVGALESFGDLFGTPTEVITSICQPRIDNFSSASIDPVELRHWRDSLIPVAERALSDDAEFGPSEDGCRWCPARGLCAAQRDWAVRRDFGPVDVLDMDEIAELLEDLPAIEAWCAAVREQALDLAYSKKKHLPGWKVVRGRGTRFITDPDAAIKLLRGKGYKLKDVTKPQEMLGIGALEKLVGKGLPGLEDYVAKSEGKPSLVRESDSRPAIDPAGDAAKEFEDMGEDE